MCRHDVFNHHLLYLIQFKQSISMEKNNPFWNKWLVLRLTFPFTCGYSNFYDSILAIRIFWFMMCKPMILISYTSCMSTTLWLPAEWVNSLNEQFAWPFMKIIAIAYFLWYINIWEIQLIYNVPGRCWNQLSCHFLVVTNLMKGRKEKNKCKHHHSIPLLIQSPFLTDI